MWYGYVPRSNLSASVSEFNRDFSGYTDDKYVYQRFKELAEECKATNLLEEYGRYEFDEMKDCIEFMNFVLHGNPMILPDRQILKYRHSNSCDTNNISIATDLMYENFLECLVMNQEVRKMVADMYRLCSDHSVNKVYRYLKEPAREIIIKCVARILLNHRYLSPTLKIEGEMALMRKNEYGTPMLWEVFDEASYLNQYLRKALSLGMNLMAFSDMMYGHTIGERWW